MRGKLFFIGTIIPNPSPKMGAGDKLPSPLVGEGREARRRRRGWGLELGLRHSIHRRAESLHNLIHFLFIDGQRRRERQCIAQRT